jgi:hypothetical protein
MKNFNTVEEAVIELERRKKIAYTKKITIIEKHKFSE